RVLHPGGGARRRRRGAERRARPCHRALAVLRRGEAHGDALLRRRGGLTPHSACATRPGRARFNSPSIARRAAANASRSAPASRVVAGILTLSGSIAAFW